MVLFFQVISLLCCAVLVNAASTLCDTSSTIIVRDYVGPAAVVANTLQNALLSRGTNSASTTMCFSAINSTFTTKLVIRWTANRSVFDFEACEFRDGLTFNVTTQMPFDVVSPDSDNYPPPLVEREDVIYRVNVSISRSVIVGLVQFVRPVDATTRALWIDSSISLGNQNTFFSASASVLSPSGLTVQNSNFEGSSVIDISTARFVGAGVRLFRCAFVASSLSSGGIRVFNNTLNVAARSTALDFDTISCRTSRSLLDIAENVVGIGAEGIAIRLTSISDCSRIFVERNTVQYSTNATSVTSTSVAAKGILASDVDIADGSLWISANSFNFVNSRFKSADVISFQGLNCSGVGAAVVVANNSAVVHTTVAESAFLAVFDKSELTNRCVFLINGNNVTMTLQAPAANTFVFIELDRASAAQIALSTNTIDIEMEMRPDRYSAIVLYFVIVFSDQRWSSRVTVASTNNFTIRGAGPSYPFIRAPRSSRTSESSVNSLLELPCDGLTAAATYPSGHSGVVLLPVSEWMTRPDHRGLIIVPCSWTRTKTLALTGTASITPAGREEVTGNPPTSDPTATPTVMVTKAPQIPAPTTTTAMMTQPATEPAVTSPATTTTTPPPNTTTTLASITPGPTAQPLPSAPTAVPTAQSSLPSIAPPPTSPPTSSPAPTPNWDTFFETILSALKQAEETQQQQQNRSGAAPSGGTNYGRKSSKKLESAEIAMIVVGSIVGLLTLVAFFVIVVVPRIRSLRLAWARDRAPPDVPVPDPNNMAFIPEGDETELLRVPMHTTVALENPLLAGTDNSL